MTKQHIIGIDLGGTNLKAACLDRSCRIRHKFSLSTTVYPRKDDLIEALVFSVEKTCRECGIRASDVAGVGIGLPGPIDVHKGLVHFFPNIPGWMDVPLTKILKARLRLPVFIDNDANLMALGEFKAGSARGSTNAICLTLGTGVGAGLIIEGRLYRGSSFAAGELGHVPLSEKGPACNCGGIACLETYIGNRRIAGQIRAMFGRDLPLEEVSRLARKGNRTAIRLWRQAGARLGLALVGVVNLLNPDRIVIGGGVANAGTVLFSSVQETILSRAMIVQAKKVKVLKAALGSDAGLIGAAFLVKEQSARKVPVR